MSSTKRLSYRIHWYADGDTAADRRLTNKLDLLVVPYAVLSYWVKYLDQANLNNAYVSNMQQDLHLGGNDLVRLQTFYTVGAVVGQLPMLSLFTYIPMHWLIPFFDIAWGIFTLLQYRVTSYAELAAYRFLVGWFEAAFFPAIHYVLGSWYRGDEIARRGGVFYVGLPLGTLTASLIQAGASAQLDGVNGLAGWRWMYIICAVITLPIGILGFFVIPGTPDQPNRKVLSQTDIDNSEARLRRAGHQNHGKFKFSTLSRVFLTPHFWAIIFVDILFWNAGIGTSAGTFLLWVKSLGRYSTSRVNELGAIAPGLGIFYVLFTCFLSDLVLGPAWAISMATLWNALGLLILTIWNVPEAAKWFAFSTSYGSVAMSSVFYGWVNTQLRASPAVRSFTLILINAVSQSTTVWTPLLVFPTIESPRFPRGFPFCLACALGFFITAHGLDLYVRRKESRENELESTISSLPSPIDAEADKGASVTIHSQKAEDISV